MKVNVKFALAAILFSILLSPSIQCCKKYEDGPGLSFKSRKTRLAQTWELKSYTINGIDSTSSFSGYTETFTKDGNFSFSSGNVSGTGTWAFYDRDTQIKLTGTENQSSRTLIITKLEQDEFWYYCHVNNNTEVFHMIKK